MISNIMTPYYFELSSFVPYKKEELIHLSSIKLIKDIDTDNYVRKDNYPIDVLNIDFIKFLESKGVNLRKVVVWHWLTTRPYIAHIDSGPDGDTITAAINWTLTSGSQVNFYNKSCYNNTEVKFGNQVLPNWSTINVGSYIPINVSGILPDSIWSGTDLCLINPALPHMVVAPVPRISVSLQLVENIPFNELVRRFKNGV